MGHSTTPAARLDTQTVLVATVASVLGGVLASALGTGPVGSLICAAITPWLTAFITHPGPHLRRRVVAVTVLLALLRAGQAAFASVLRRSRRRPKREGENRHGPADVLGRHRSRLASAAGGIAFATALLVLTVPEIVLGQAFVAERRLTLFAVGNPNPAKQHHAAVALVGPTLEVPAAPVRRDATDRRGARVRYRVRAIDSRGAALRAACRPSSGRFFPVGTTTVTCIATEGRRAAVKKRFQVIVAPRTESSEGSPDPGPRHRLPPATPDHGAVPSPPATSDTIAPRLTVPTRVRAVTEDAAGVVVRYDASAIDADGHHIPVGCTPASGTLFALGRTVVRCVARDEAGNASVRRFPVEVLHRPDDVAPRLYVPALVRLRAADAGGAIVRYRARAVDARDGVVPVTCRPPTGARFRLGTTSVRCRADDQAGNRATRAFDVIVLAPPAPSEPGRPDVRPPEFTGSRAILVETTERAGTPVDYPRPAARDDRDETVAVRCVPARVAAGAVTSVTCTATDAAGNTGRAAFRVTVRVIDTVAPWFPDRGPIVVTSPEPVGTAVEYPLPRADDDQDQAVDVACTPRTAPVGDAISVTCTATDDAGNRARAGFRVRVDASDGGRPRGRSMRAATLTPFQLNNTASR
jgi:hypothetical protein